MAQVTELTVNTRLSGDFEEAYRSGDNSKVVPTDTQKNTVYALAKKVRARRLRAHRHGLAGRHDRCKHGGLTTGPRALCAQHGCDGPESFGLILCRHFLTMYPWVDCATVEATQHT